MSPPDPQSKAREIDQYNHKGQTRLNNPPVGLVTPETDKLNGRTRYEYDPHLDPQLIWAGKAEHSTLQVPRVSLHVHERIDPRTIIEALRQRSSSGRQRSLFEFSDENPPLREAIEFYKHNHNWTNRLISGDSLLVMNSLLEKEGMGGKVQVIFIDPPYGIKYGSNFQPFVNRRRVVDGKDSDLTQEPEMVQAFRDTWEFGIHSYLSYLRNRLHLASRLLAPSGSVFVQISDVNLHHVKELLDEIFGTENYCAVIPFLKTTSSTAKLLGIVSDYLLWYAKDKKQVKYRQLYAPRSELTIREQYTWIELPNGTPRALTIAELSGKESIPPGRRFMPGDTSAQSGGDDSDFPVTFEGVEYRPPPNSYWKTGKEGFERLIEANRLVVIGNRLRYKRFSDDFPYAPVNAFWVDTVISGFGEPKLYVVQTATKVVERCLLMTSDPGDLVLDPTCGSGTTAYCAEKWGRRWITCDTSRVALALTRQRLMTATYQYYCLAQPSEGVANGFRYKRVPHLTLASVAKGEKPDIVILYDTAVVDTTRTRVSGPFTTEAVPAPTVYPLTGSPHETPADSSVARTGETIRQGEWRDELLRSGVRGRSGQRIEFTRVEPLPALYWLHAECETKADIPERAVVSFGPAYAAMEPRQVALAIDEAQRLVPRPKLVVFAAFQFDPEASKDIDETEWPGVQLLKVQMNPDMFTDDLKKKRASNESFWLIGQPDVRLARVKDGKYKDKWILEVCGFDYYNTKTGSVESGGTNKIALWMLDTDYDGRSLFPRQIFLPLAGEKEGWSKVARTLRGEINEEVAEAYRGTVSLPFEPGKNKRVAVKIIDDRGIESLKVIEVD